MREGSGVSHTTASSSFIADEATGGGTQDERIGRAARVARGERPGRAREQRRITEESIKRKEWNGVEWRRWGR